MIYSTLNRLDWELDQYPEAIQEALCFLKDTNFEKLQDGKYELCGEEIFVILGKMETKPLREMKPEAHDRYMDIQCLLTGKEKIGFAQRGEAEAVEDFLEEKDVCFFDTDLRGESFLAMESGEYAIFFPEDIHRPLVRSEGIRMVRKAIVKIRMDLLGKK